MRLLVVSLGSVLGSMSMVFAAHGLLSVLVPTRAIAAGWSDGTIGLIGSLFYIGQGLGSFLGPRIILGAGHIRTFTAMLGVATAGVLTMPIIGEVAAWGLARLAIGVALGSVILVAESWLNERADASIRGTVIAFYVMLSYAFITGGQFLEPLGSGPTAFSFAAILFALAAVPVGLTRSQAPAPVAIAAFDPKALFRISPVGVVGVAVNGAMTGVFFSLAPAYAIARGIDGVALPLFTGAALAAGALAQIPAGALSDRMDRRYVLIGLALVTALACAGLASLPREAIGFGGLLALAVLFGTVMMPGYAVAAAHAFDHAAPERYVQLSAGLLLVYSAGGALSPLLAGILMGWLGAGAAFGMLGVLALAFASFVAIRIVRRDPIAGTDKEGFTIAMSAPISAVATSEAVLEKASATHDRDAPGLLETLIERRMQEGEEDEED